MSNNLVLRVAFNLINGATKPLQNIMAGSNQLGASLKATRDKLKALDKVQQDIGAFREMRAGVSATSAQMAAAQARVASLAQAMQAAGTPTKAMTRDFEKAKQAAAQLKTAHEQQQGQLQQLRTRLSGAGIDTRNLSQHERDLRANITSTNAAMLTQQTRLTDLAARERRLGEARNRMNATKETAGKITGAGAAMAVGGAVTTAALTVPVSAYAKAEDSATQLQVALMRAGATVPPEFEKINALAMKLGDRLPGTTSDFQDMMTMLNRQGISAQSILGGMGEATAYLGVQLKKAPNEAAEFAAKMQDATRTTEKDMMGLMDVIQRTFYLGVDDNNMLQGFSKLSPAMDTLKQKGLEGAKALAPLLVMADQAGMKGEAAGNAFRKIFQMSMDKKKIDKGNKELAPGKKLEFTDGKGEFGGLDNMFKQLDKLKGLTTQKRLGLLKEIFGDDAETLQAIALMMDKGVAGYSEVQGKMSAQASLQERVNKQLGTLKNLWEATTGTFTNGMVAFGESIAPELKATTEWLGDMAQKMGAWARENPRLAGALMKTAAALAILLTVGGALLLMAASVLGPMAMLKFSMTTLGMQGGLMANVFRMMVAPLRLVGSAVLFLGQALLANPIGLLIAGIAVAAFLIYKYWEPIKAFFGNLWDGVKATFEVALTWFTSLPAKFTEFGANLIGGLVNGITNGLGAVKDAITNVATTTVTWFKDKLGIHSPSRVFGELGGFISEGAALGMENQQGKVAKAALGLALAATATFSQAGSPIVGSQPPIDARGPLMAGQAGAAAGTGAGAGNTYSINITAAPGMDPAAIARAVSAELDRRDRAAQTRNGSRLSD
jgi:TP901 family phage tail tape measure protein